MEKKYLCLKDVAVTDSEMNFMYTAFEKGTAYRAATRKEQNASPGPGDGLKFYALINSHDEVHYMDGEFLIANFLIQ